MPRSGSRRLDNSARTRATPSAAPRLATALTAGIPRSNILAELTEALPDGTSLLEMTLESRPRLDPVPAGSTAFDMKKAQIEARRGAETIGVDIAAEEELIRISGLAQTDVQVAQYLNQLSRSPLFQDVGLLVSETQAAPGAPAAILRRFQIQMTVNPSARLKPASSDPDDGCHHYPVTPEDFRMKRSSSWLWFAGAIVTVVAGAHFLIIHPANQRRESLQREIAQKRVALANLDRSAEMFRIIDTKIDRLRCGNRPVWREVWIGPGNEQDARRPLASGRIKFVADEDGQDSRAEKRNDSFREQEIELSVTGHFSGYYQFLLQLERLPRVMRIKRMHVTKMNVPDGQVQAEMTLSVFFAPEVDVSEYLENCMTIRESDNSTAAREEAGERQEESLSDSFGATKPGANRRQLGLLGFVLACAAGVGVWSLKAARKPPVDRYRSRRPGERSAGFSPKTPWPPGESSRRLPARAD